MRRSTEQGFSLVEALVAASVAAAVMAALLQALAGSARLSARAADRSAAVLVAESVLAGPPVLDAGTTGGFDWERQVTVDQVEDQAALIRVTVAVTGPQVRRPVTLSALRVVRP